MIQNFIAPVSPNIKLVGQPVYSSHTPLSAPESLKFRGLGRCTHKSPHWHGLVAVPSHDNIKAPWTFRCLSIVTPASEAFGVHQPRRCRCLFLTRIVTPECFLFVCTLAVARNAGTEDPSGASFSKWPSPVPGGQYKNNQLKNMSLECLFPAIFLAPIGGSVVLSPTLLHVPRCPPAGSPCPVSRHTAPGAAYKPSIFALLVYSEIPGSWHRLYHNSALLFSSSQVLPAALRLF